MQVKLRVMRGAHAGREISLTAAKFTIGRGEECQLRPRSEAVSRRHCILSVEGNEALVEDLGSKNGTLVNGQRVEGTQALQAGDQLQVGPLLFEVCIDHALGGAKRPVVKDVKEAAARTALGNTEDLDITRWLEDDADTATSKAVASPETRQFRLDDTNNLALETNIGHEPPETEQPQKPEQTEPKEAAAAEEPAQGKEDKKGRWKKSGPGRLPPRHSSSSKDSREAAADMLKRFFNRR
jgi:pSer/pThr/pTyr-binding forkhead associated (FHA) protein